MNFLGLGPGELILILGLALVVVGPAKLPEIAAQIGKTIRDFRQSTSEITSEFQRSFSLEDPEPAAPVAGPAEVVATHGAAGVEESSAGTAAGPLADTSDWHWETSGSAQPARSAADANASFWNWDPLPEASTPSTTATASIATTGWEWDEAPPAPTNSTPPEQAALPLPAEAARDPADATPADLTATADPANSEPRRAASPAEA